MQRSRQRSLEFRIHRDELLQEDEGFAPIGVSERARRNAGERQRVHILVGFGTVPRTRALQSFDAPLVLVDVPEHVQAALLGPARGPALEGPIHVPQLDVLDEVDDQLVLKLVRVESVVALDHPAAQLAEPVEMRSNVGPSLIDGQIVPLDAWVLRHHVLPRVIVIAGGSPVRSS